MSTFILAIDQGTTSSRAIVFDENLREISSASRPVSLAYPQNGFVEQDPEELLSSVFESITEALAKAKLAPGKIAAIGITNQRETTLLWDRKTGKCVHPAIVWQCRRTEGICRKLRDAGLEDMVKNATGLVIDPYFSGTKIQWLLDNVPDVRKRAEAGELMFGTVDSFLVWHLTGGTKHVTDYTNASRTMIFNIHKLVWDDELLERLRIPKAILPGLVPSSGVSGMVNHPVLGGFPIPIAGIAGDQQSALFGQFCDRPCELKITYGTGAFLLLNTGTAPVSSRNGLLTTLAVETRPGKAQYALEGSVFMAGAIMQWLRDGLGILKDTSMTGKIAASIPDTGGVTMVPAFTGLGAPHWNPKARAAITGMTRATTAKEIIRAADESIAFQCDDLLKAMQQDLGQKLLRLRVDGGATRDDFLLQFQADISNQTLERPAYVESTALGAARLALVALGLPARSTPETTLFNPKMSAEERECHLARWKKALASTLD